MRIVQRLGILWICGQTNIPDTQYGANNGAFLQTKKVAGSPFNKQDALQVVINAGNGWRRMAGYLWFHFFPPILPLIIELLNDNEVLMAVAFLQQSEKVKVAPT